MSTYTPNLGLLEKNPTTEGSDLFNVGTMLNDNWDKIDSYVALVAASIAPAYSASSAYAVGAWCTHGGKLWQCSTAIGAGGEAWNEAHWTAVTAAQLIAAVSAAVEGKAPTSHAASADTYGKGTGTSYGHLKLSDATDDSSDADGGIAATPKAVKAVENTKADKTALATFVRPNLLDNWYFVGGGSQQGGGQFPINQRDGYIVVPTSENPESLYWSSANNVGVTQGGTINEYNKVVRFGTNASGINYAVYVFEGTEFFTLRSTVVHGYIGSEYGIDRYNVESGGTLTINDKYCSFSGISIQSCEDTTVDSLVGITVTVSALTYDGSLVSATGKVNPKNQDTIISAALNSNNAYVELHFFANAQYYQTCRIYGGDNNGTVNLVAVKLELGDTQTLAHQENGVWVLNEIPDYNEQVIRCTELPASPAKVEYGSYTGTGTYGSSNPNSLAFSLVPQLVLIKRQSNSQYSIVAANGLSAVYSDYSTSYANNLTWDGMTLEWYNASGAARQLNESGVTYCYVAIG